MPHFVGKQIELTIERLAYDGGRGVGRNDNFVFFVQKTAPGDRILAQITSLKKNYGEAELSQILVPSPHRRSPPCPVATECGGCPWQHIDYAEQLQQKRGLLQHALKPFYPSSLDEIEVLPSHKEFRYRNRVQLHTRTNANGAREFGFFKANSNELVAIQDCLIADEHLFLGLEAEELGSKKTELALDDNGRRVMRDLAITPSEFTQVHSAQNEALKGRVTDLCTKAIQRRPTNGIWDLYCGSGNFTFPIARSNIQIRVTGVEESPQAIGRARGVLAKLAAPHIQFLAEPVEHFLDRTHTQIAQIFVLDPPRAGLGSKVCQHIKRLKPHTLVYISCNLSTLARDLRDLSTASNGVRYEIHSVVGLDMFPQTEHVETVVELHLLLV